MSVRNALRPDFRGGRTNAEAAFPTRTPRSTLMKRFLLLAFGVTIATLAHAECDSNVEANESLASIKERLGCFARELAALRAEVDILRNIETENENLRAQLDA